jgi:hypothetical protein
MKINPTRPVPSNLAANAKAAEDCRTSKASPVRTLLVRTPASWTAAALCRFAFAVLLLLGQFSVIDRAAAQVPERFSFQGYMEDGNGQPLGPSTPVNYTVDFRIYSAATGGTLLWGERQIVTFDKGNYSVILGQGSQISGAEPHGDLSAVVINATGSELFVETTVTISGTPATINPRLRLLPAMQAFLAKKALSVDGAGISANSITEDRLSVALASTINSGPIADTRLSLGLRNYITNGPIADSRLSANVVRGNFPNSFTQIQQFNNGLISAGPFPTQLNTPLTTVNGILIASGPVGIGTNGTSKLIVNGGVRARGGAPGTSGANDNGYAFSGNNGDTDSGMFSSADGQLEFYGNNVERMRISTSGRVGIGTGNPSAQLHVVGKPSVFIGQNQASWGIDINDVSRDNHHMNGPGNQPLSIMADGQILAGVGFLAVSDARIKRDLHVSEGAKDLATIQQLKVTDFQFIDWVNKGRERKKGFIAQEVQAVIPEAITINKSFIPDIFAPAASVTVHPEAGTMTVRMTKAHGLKAGDKVRLLTDDATQEVMVSKAGPVTELEFEVEQFKGEPKRVFVYGREVSDFMAVDYDRIFTTGIGAIQELARRANELELKVKELGSKQAQVAELESKAARADALERANSDLQSRIERQDKRLAALETLVREKLSGVQQAGLQSVGLSEGK